MGKRFVQSTVVRCRFPENYRLKKVHILVLSFNAFTFVFSFVHGSGCEDSNLIFV